MNTSWRKRLLRANALFLMAASVGALATMDLPLIFTGGGPAGRVLGNIPYVGIGFLEAHGLALILGVLLWFAAPERKWHATAAAIHLLLGSSNLICWQLFVATDTLPMGYVTTALHGLLASLQSAAAFTHAVVPVSIPANGRA
jgi:hypothetical protein